MSSKNRMLNDVLSGLSQTQKSIPSKYFYDERGSKLFEHITKTDEYYLTRCELEILQQHIGEIAGYIGHESVLVELGSGSSRKTRFLLDNLRNLTGYIPVDISRKYLKNAEEELKAAYPEISVRAVCADYTEPFELPEIEQNFQYYVFFYPGSTIGNFHPRQAQLFLQRIARFLVPGGGLLIGVDLEKDPEIIEKAYNDSKGITAEFNKNLLVRLNRELSADFNIVRFIHRAFYNTSKRRIEMHLVSTETQTITLNGQAVSVGKNETIHTENSYKYSLEKFEKLVNNWFGVEKVWTDENDLFSVQYLVKK